MELTEALNTEHSACACRMLHVVARAMLQMTTAPARRAAVSARISADVKDWLSRILRAETSARGRIPCARARAWHLFLHDIGPDRSLIYVQAIGPSDNPL